MKEHEHPYWGSHDIPVGHTVTVKKHIYGDNGKVSLAGGGKKGIVIEHVKGTNHSLPGYKINTGNPETDHLTAFREHLIHHRNKK